MKRSILLAIAVAGLMLQACAQKHEQQPQQIIRQQESVSEPSRLTLTDFTDVASATIDAPRQCQHEYSFQKNWNILKNVVCLQLDVLLFLTYNHFVMRNLYIACIVLTVVFLQGVASAQSSLIEKYNSSRGTNVITRYNDVDNYLVTCAKNMYGNSFFIVQDGSVKRTFDMPVTTGNFNVSGIGFVVNDVQIYGSTCWFCGTNWEETYELVYPPEIGAPPYLVFKTKNAGFIGRFDIAQALTGVAQLHISIIGEANGDTVSRLDKLATYGTGVVSIGNIDTTDTPVLVEFTDTPTGICNFTVWRPDYGGEQFVDVESTNGRIVTLSRYKDTLNSNFFHWNYGLRYGTPGNFILTGNTVYMYDTYYPFLDGRARFTGMDPIVLSSVHQGHDVTVSFVVNNNTSFNGRFVVYHIPSAGAVPLDVVFNRTHINYSIVKDADFNNPMTFNTYMSLLLEDHQGNSVLRFPYLNQSPMIQYDTVWSILEPRIESLAAYQNMSNRLNLYAGGYYSQDANKIAEFNEIMLHDHFMINNDCMEHDRGELQSVHTYEPPTTPPHPLVNMFSQTSEYMKFQYKAPEVEAQIECRY